ncbi:MAG TPA: 2-polyprenyl-6-methoxyphenol hydroxylase-like oxidoreductase, partial [Blastocatellia bacterium]|nr:2-polyprenyl-6-methoxyphenol hydroxylase-like oxidoreductase [Blastocatellia bacterium]
AFLGYASRIYRRTAVPRDWSGIYVQAAPPSHSRGGVLFPIEGDRWLLTVVGLGRDYPPTDEAGFLEFARSMRAPAIYNAIKDAEPLSDIYSYRGTENRVRHYERMSRRPEGLLVLGDAACAFNPVYGQGMTTAALSAQTLSECLNSHRGPRLGKEVTGLADRFQKKLAKANTPAWLLATGEDLRVPEVVGKKPGLADRLMQRYVDRVVELSTENEQARLLLLEVFNLLKPPTALFHPAILAQMLKRGFRIQHSEPGRKESGFRIQKTASGITKS